MAAKLGALGLLKTFPVSGVNDWETSTFPLITTTPMENSPHLVLANLPHAFCLLRQATHVVGTTLPLPIRKVKFAGAVTIPSLAMAHIFPLRVAGTLYLVVLSVVL